MTLHAELDRYLHLRRMFGVKLKTDELRLRSFVTFVDQAGKTFVTFELILDWMKCQRPASSGTKASRFSAVRQFAQWLRGMDDRHEDPPPRGFVPGYVARPAPYIYSNCEIAEIIRAAQDLPSIYGIRGLTCAMLYGLVAVTGMRIGEALALDTADFDVERQLLHIRSGKNCRERILPIDPGVAQRLTNYCAERDRLLERHSQSLFVNCKGERPNYCWARANFVRVCQSIGLRGAWTKPMAGKPPRIHDLRHTFAVRTLTEWYRAGNDAAREMHKLTIYLGHEGPRDTYWYLQAVPELLELASARLTEGLALEESQ
jgi:integrase/recombinase XerD